MTNAECKTAAAMIIRTFELRLQAATQWRAVLEFVSADPELIRAARGNEIKIESYMEQVAAALRDDPSPERFAATFQKNRGTSSWQ
jgi:hypothetical protein